MDVHRMKLEPRQRILLALDVESLDAARDLVRRTEGVVGGLKVGKELFTRCGPEAVRAWEPTGLPVFLDLKFHDIPNTVAGAVRAAAQLGVRWLSLHTSGGADMLQAAAAARDEQPSSKRPRLLGVTLLTSLHSPDPEEIVERALLAQRCGLDGAIASPQEVARLRTVCKPEFLLVTPGVRPAGSEVGDQKRTATPAAAIRNGSDYLVIGRPIHAAADPRTAAQAILDEIASAGSTSSITAAPEAGSVESRLLDMLRRSEAFLEGHFILTSGLHSNRYVQCARLLQYPHYARRAGIWLADRLRPYGPQVVISVALGGLVIGQEVAAALEVPALFAERDEAGTLQLRRGFELEPGTRVAIADDVCTRGGSIAECAELVQKLGARVVVAGSIIDRSGGARAFDLPFEALRTIEARAVKPETCEACAAGIPAVKPGSRRKAV